MRLPSFLVLSVLAVGLAPAAVPATATAAGCDRYAAPTGSDGAPGTSARPFRSAQRLVEALSPGDTGCLRAGRYRGAPGRYALRVGRGGRARAPITVRSAPGERAQLVGTVMVAHGADDVRLSRLDFIGTGGSNTVKVYAADTVIEDSDITNGMRGDSCMMIGSPSGGRAVRTVVRRSVIHDCGAPGHGNKDHGIYVGLARGGEIVDNVIVNPVAYAIQLYPDADRMHVAGNIADGGPATVRGGIVIGGDGRSVSRDNLVERNVISYTETGAVSGYWPGQRGRGNVVRDNCTWATDRRDQGDGGLAMSGNVFADPGFRARKDGDYRLGRNGRCAAVVGDAVGVAARLRAS